MHLWEIEKKTVFTWNKWHASGEIEHSAAPQCQKDVPAQGCEKTRLQCRQVVEDLTPF